ncbi:uncharacterized protein SCHCODRAFT_02225356 [Schizophyllum commune H4-8]|uniref:uncharacterized protein n=1 Tax=Schizophyllum commune (strain H4-8 / FGSC 9210) TaxID=578458 RepID=UPI00215F0C85|nr:uncharacterized protein SCHCODRAFT_02225356 [Schizophyllum commune H4-8]KAI5895210.1 hypothetical protein SCHCODRAFT_02225356 [Schizophyllum commune H4-8]
MGSSLIGPRNASSVAFFTDTSPPATLHCSSALQLLFTYSLRTVSAAPSASVGFPACPCASALRSFPASQHRLSYLPTYVLTYQQVFICMRPIIRAVDGEVFAIESDI